MGEDFYTQWLRIPPGPRPPDHYALLGVPRFCRDQDAIESAARRRLTQLDQYAMHPDRATRDAVQDMMDEVAQARVHLIDPARQQAYDEGLARLLGVSAPAAAVPVVAVPVVAVERKGPPALAARPVAAAPRRKARVLVAPPVEEDEEDPLRWFEARIWAHLRKWRLNPQEERLLVAEATGFGIRADDARRMIHEIDRRAEARAEKKARRTTVWIVTLGLVGAAALIVTLMLARSARAKRETAFEASISQARECLKTEDLQGARKHLAKARDLHPGDRELGVFEAELEAKREELAKRSTSLLAQALDLMRRGELKNAGSTLAQAREIVSRISPADQGLASRLRQGEEELSRRKPFEARLAEAQAALAEGNFGLAQSKLNEAEQLFPRDRRLAILEAELKAKREELGKRFTSLLAQALDLMRRGELENAERTLAQARKIVSRSSAGDQEPASRLRQAEEELSRRKPFEARLSEAQAASAEGNFGLAQSKLDEAEQLFPRDRRLEEVRADVEARRKAALAEKQKAETFKACLADFRKALDRGDVQLAQKKLDKAEQLYPQDPRIPDLRVKLKALKKAARAYADLMERGRSVLSQLPASPLRVTEAQRARIANAIRDGEAALKLKPGDEAAAALIVRLRSYVPLTLDLGRGVSMKLRWIPAGKFLMGSPESDASAGFHEKPQHTVTISKPFYMGVTEVTRAQWKAVMGTEPWKRKTKAKQGGENAASYIPWDHATLFCKKLSAKTGRTVRLPTEAEWEYACRAGTTTTYSFGDDDSKLGDYAWYDKNADDLGEKYAHAVARKKPNAWGLYDMHGNVWEWCADWYGEKYYSATGNTVDPTGPASGKERVLRGGSWQTDGRYDRSAYRSSGHSPYRYSFIGFRVVVSLGSGVD